MSKNNIESSLSSSLLGAKSEPKGKLKKDSKSKIKSYQYKTKYGITLEQYEAIKDNQKGCCKICKIKTEELVVDHCHDTNIVRGLLCTNCNLALGHFKDNVEAIQEALLYLQESRYYEVSGVKIPIKQFCNNPIFKIEKIKINH